MVADSFREDSKEAASGGWTGIAYRALDFSLPRVRPHCSVHTAKRITSLHKLSYFATALPLLINAQEIVSNA